MLRIYKMLKLFDQIKQFLSNLFCESQQNKQLIKLLNNLTILLDVILNEKWHNLKIV